VTSAARQSFGHLAGAVADGAGDSVVLAGAVAMAADILAGAGGSGGGFVARSGVVVAHVRPTPAGGTGSAGNRQPRRRVSRGMKPILTGAALALAFAAAPAQAQELFGGVLVHDVDTGLTKSGIEEGVDFELGWRGERIRFLRAVGAPTPQAFVSLNSAGNTHFAAAGIAWKIGGRVYLRPAIGVAVHTGPGRVVPSDDRIDFGSRILFAPELGLGARLTSRASIEASWVHLSHAQLFGPQNPGLDTIGLRLNYRFR
jgi:lipid A 3-O-deacylase